MQIRRSGDPGCHVATDVQHGGHRVSNRRQGKTIGLGPPKDAQWMWLEPRMLQSQTYQALGVNARRILDFLMCESCLHGGLENGNLCAPYAQLGKQGCTVDDVRKGLEELYVTGFIDQRVAGQRIAGGGDPARYALTWMPAVAPTAKDALPAVGLAYRKAQLIPATGRWEKVIGELHREGIGGVRETRSWLKLQTVAFSRSQRAKAREQRKQAVTPHMQAA